MLLSPVTGWWFLRRHQLRSFVSSWLLGLVEAARAPPARSLQLDDAVESFRPHETRRARRPW